MYLLKRLSLAVLAVAFSVSLFAATGNAQDGRYWKGNNGNHRGWYQGRHRGWDNGRKRGWQNRNVYLQQQYYGYSRVSPWEYRRMQRQRYNIYRTRNRYYDDGYLSYKERRKLAKKYYKYRRNSYRDRRNW